MGYLFEAFAIFIFSQNFDFSIIILATAFNIKTVKVFIFLARCSKTSAIFDLNIVKEPESEKNNAFLIRRKRILEQIRIEECSK